MKKKDSLTKNTMLLSIGAFMTKGISFIMVPFFSRWLSTAEYGTFDLLATYVTLLLPLVGLASNEALFRFSMDVDAKEDKKKYVTNSLVIYSINTLLLFVALVTIRFTTGWKFALYFFLLAVGEIYNLYLRGFLRAIKHLDIYSFVNAISTLFIAIFTTIFIKGFGLGLEGMILGYGLGYIAGDIIIVLWTKYWTYISFKEVSFSGMKELVSYSYALIPNNISWWFINVSDRTIIKMFLGATQNGIYAIAYKIPNILSSVFGVFSISWQQSATETLEDENRDKYYNTVYNRLSVVLISLCCGVLSLNSWMFNYIFDVKYHDGYLYAPILIASTVIATLSQFYGSIQISLKQPKDNGITTVIGAVANLIIHLVLVNYVGLYAAAISTVVSQIIVCILRHLRLRETVKLNFTKKTYIFWGIYAYFTVMAYCIEHFQINFINVLIAIALVIWENKEYGYKILKKFNKKSKSN